MKFRVRHTTRYRYSAPVSLCHNVAHLRPRATATQSCDSSQLSVVPAPAHVHAWEDLFGNLQDAFSIQQPHSELSVTALSEVEVVSAGDLLVSAFPIAWEQALEHLREAGDPRVLEARQFRLESNFVEFSSGILEYAAPSVAAGGPLLEAVHDDVGEALWCDARVAAVPFYARCGFLPVEERMPGVRVRPGDHPRDPRRRVP